MQATYSNGTVALEEHKTLHEAFLSGEEHMENGAVDVHIFNQKPDPKRKARRKMVQASRRRNRK
jgi:hypothetical protein